MLKGYGMKLLFISMLVGLLLFAEDTSTEPIVIKKLITKIKSASVKEKRVLINQLKIQLKSMGKKSRKKAMMELKKSFSQKNKNSKNNHQKQKKHEHCQQMNHQPQYRHLQKGPKDGSQPRRGQGEGRK